MIVIEYPKEALSMRDYVPLMDRLVAAEKKTRPEYQVMTKWAWSATRDGRIEIQVFRGCFGYAGEGRTAREAFCNLCENFAAVLLPPPETLDDPGVQERIEKRAAFLEVVATLYAEAGGDWWKP